MGTHKPIFIDRDGVINVDVTPYVSTVDQLQIFPWTAEALHKLHLHGYEIFVISNQQGVALGITSLKELAKMEEAIQTPLRALGFSIGKFYYCTARNSENDPCRKPAPGMLLAAQKEFDLDLSSAYFIGDKWSDIECALRAGCHPILVLSGVTAPGGWENWKHKPERVFSTLKEAVDWVTAQ